MSKQPLFIAFTNQKGGVGKSAVTVMMASYLHYLGGKSVLVVDCDYPQHSIANMRERDKAAVDRNDNYKRMMMERSSRTGGKAYPVLTTRPDNALKVVSDFLGNDDRQFDLVLFDLPGTVNTPGMFTVLFNMNYLFIPIVSDRMVMQSSMAFATTLQDYMAANKDIVLKGVYLFWNRLDRRVTMEVFHIYKHIMAQLKLNVLETTLPETFRYSRELSVTGRPFFRSTLLPPMGKLLTGSNLSELAEEILGIIKL